MLKQLFVINRFTGYYFHKFVPRTSVKPPSYTEYIIVIIQNEGVSDFFKINH